jgi:acyl dehydratase
VTGEQPEFRFPVEAGHIMMFARALGDDNPIYADPDHEATRRRGGVVAPPTFVAAGAQFDPDWPWRPRPDSEWMGSGSGPGTTPAVAGTGTSLHAEQHYEFHRPLRPGDVLTVVREQGEAWEKQSKRAGTLRFSTEISYYRDQDGELVVTAKRVRVVTERKVDG